MATINGTAGHDVLTGTADDDLIRGGAGGDTLVLAGKSADAVFSIDPQGRWVVTSAAGVDVLTGMEWVRFDDTTVALGAHLTLVNSRTMGDQLFQQATGLADGGYVVCWTSWSAGGAGSVFLQRYSAEGTTVGAEVRIQTASTSINDPVVQGLPDGGYVVAWSAWGPVNTETDVFLQRFSADGAALGEFGRVNTYAPSSQSQVGVAALGDGGFLVTWNSHMQEGVGIDGGIYGQRFAADGDPVGGEFHVNTTIQNDQWNPSAAGLANGGFVVAWQSFNVSNGSRNGWDVLAQAYAADGTPVGAEFLVHGDLDAAQADPTVVALADGGYVVTWSYAPRNQGLMEIQGQRFAADGSAVGAPLRVNSTTDGYVHRPSAASLDDGGFVVSWIWQSDEGSDYRLQVQKFAADGSYVGGEQTVIATTQQDPREAKIAALGGGGYVVTWYGYASYSYGSEVFQQRFAADGTPVGSGSILLGGDSDDVIQVSGPRAVEISAGAGDDILAGGAGDDTLDGGDGVDTVDLSTGLAQVSWGVDVDGRAYVAGAQSGVDGLLDVERVHALDGGITVSYGAIDAMMPMLVLGPQLESDVLALADGGYVVVWRSDADDGVTRLHAQRFDADGVPLAIVANVNTTPLNYVPTPVATGLAGGGYVVIWSGRDDGGDLRIYGQRYAADGSAADGEFQVQATLPTLQGEAWPQLTALADGGFLVTWASINAQGTAYNVFAQRYGADGSPAGPDTRVNTSDNLIHATPAVAELADGSYVIAWSDAPRDGSGYGVYAQRFAADGSRIAGEFQVNTFAAGNQQYPVVTALESGGFVVTWISQDADRQGWGVIMQRYDADGVAAGPEVRAGTTSWDDPWARTAALADGSYVVTWTADQEPQDSIMDVFARHFEADGAPRGDEYRVNTVRVGAQWQPHVVGLADGGYLMSWLSYHSGGIHSQRFLSNGARADHLTITGDTQDNMLRVDAGSFDTVELAGGSGNDTLAGAGRADVLTGGEGDDTFLFAADRKGVDLVTDFAEGDAIRVVGAAFSGPVAGGNGTTVGRDQVQVASVAGVTTLYVGTDDTAGADVVMQLAGSFDANMLSAQGEFIRLRPAAPGVLQVALANDSGQPADAVTSDATLAIQGVDAGATVEYSANGVDWSTSYGPVEGFNTVHVRQRSAGGVAGEASTLSFTFDTIAAAPDVALAADTGVAGDRVTNDASLALAGVEAGAVVEYSVDGRNWATSFVATEGANTVQVRQRDLAGNVSVPTTLAFTLDTQIGAPTVALAIDTGIAGDRVTNTSALSLTGVEAGAVVEYSIDGTNWTNAFAATEGANTTQVRQRDVAGNVSGASALSFVLDTQAAAPGVALATDSGVDGDRITSNAALAPTGLEAGAAVEYSTNGTIWTSGFAATEGANTVQVRQRDVAGNVSSASTLAFTLDTQVAAPGIALAADTGIAGDRITRNGALSLSGLEAGATVEYSTNGTIWTNAFTATEGANSVQVRQRDVAGNLSGANTLAFTLDTQVVAPGVALASDSGIAGDRITNSSTLALTGLEAGATVEYSTNGTSWSGSFSAAQGLNSVYVRQRDLAGNQGSGTALTFTFDNQVTAPVVALTTDTGIAGDRISRVATLTVSGIEAGAAVQYSKDGVLWGAGFAATEGANTAYVRQSDVAGNVSAATVLAFTLDTVANAPVVTLANDSGIAGDRITNNATLAVAGVESGATVQYSRDSVNWTATFTPTQGANTVYARQTDVAGNLSAPSAALNFTYDTVAPGVAGNLADTQIVNGYVNAARNLATQTLTGTSPAFATVTVWDGATAVGTVTANNLGRWNLVLGSLADGSHSLTATTSDVAGNVSAPSAALAFKVDTLGPVTLITDVVQTNATTTIVKGTSEANSTVTIREFNGPVLTTTAPVIADAAGQWTATLRNIGNNDHVLVASGTDAASNTGLASNQAILGTTAGDNLTGAGNGNLVLGNGGTNFLGGGTGVDKFVFHANMGGNFVFGFNPAEDVLYFGRDVVPLGVTTNAQLEAWVEANASDVFGSAYIQIDAQQTIALVGVPTANLGLLNYELL